MNVKKTAARKSVSIREIKNSVARLLEQVSSKKMSLKEAREEVSKMLEQIESGEEFLILRDGEAVAKIIPLLD